MNLKTEKRKKVIFLVLTIVCICIMLVGDYLIFLHQVNNAGYAVIPALFAMIFLALYRNSKKAIEENTDKTETKKED